MLITKGNNIGGVDRKKVKEVKTFRAGWNWLTDYITKEENSGRIHHWYTRVLLYEDFLAFDYGDYSTFIFFDDLPENWKEQLDKINEEEKKKRNAKL